MYFDDNSYKEEPFSNKTSEKNSWESGVRFVEEKRSKKTMRFISLILVVILSASIGGIIGGYYVKKSYAIGSEQINSPLNTKNASDNNLNMTPETADIPKNAITAVAQKVGPAVVGVNNNAETWGGGTALQGSGSGIIFDKSGYIVTNYHVIQGASNVTISLSGGRKIPARVIGFDSQTDLAVVKVEAKNLPVAKFGDSGKIRVGDTAIAIGNPLGEEFAGTVTSGIVSALNRKIQTEDRTYSVIQTDATINPGNSGGALCNAAGEVIGINTLKISSAEGMGFAIPINEAKPIIERLMKNGYVARPFIGISGQFIDSDQAKIYDVPVGIFIQQVVQGSGAEAAGIRSGDIIVAFDGTEIKEYDDLTTTLAKHKIGDVISAKIWRDGKYIDVKITIGDSQGRS